MIDAGGAARSHFSGACRTHVADYLHNQATSVMDACRLRHSVRKGAVVSKKRMRSSRKEHVARNVYVLKRIFSSNVTSVTLRVGIANPARPKVRVFFPFLFFFVGYAIKSQLDRPAASPSRAITFQLDACATPATQFGKVLAT